ncbi:hypothetical protein FZI91_20740 [Mycobacterium sp. CBMA271]|uniref:hypothetical protein n=1 Tax=unclassified Mycobacteroides TaxID=2618759 RepID=UPI0012DF4641|nr:MULTISPECIES: hypothetical protein [unclassified Mycobacteroides]MUM16895.1 hypothetical protein [Mycobacteroides sp. CBMA 326]MUM24116.1 hypothetical protein [Mycobacteroides sp. CBMA 271]
MDKKRFGFVVLVVVGLVCAAIVGWIVFDDQDLSEYEPYSATRQNQNANTLVAQLNDGIPRKVSVVWATEGPDDAVGRDFNGQTERMVRAAMPLPGCNYTLNSITDRGRQDRKGDTQTATYRYDMHITEHCPHNIQYDRLIGVIAHPGYGAHWYDYRFIIKR